MVHLQTRCKTLLHQACCDILGLLMGGGARQEAVKFRLHGGDNTRPTLNEKGISFFPSQPVLITTHARVDDFLQNLTIVLATAAVAAVLFQKLRLPVVLGYIIAGLIIGPHVPIPLVAVRACKDLLLEK